MFSLIAIYFIGIFVILWALLILFLFIGSQGGFAGGGLLGLFCLACGVGILMRNALMRKAFLIGSVPVSLFAALSLLALTKPDVPDYFRMTIDDIIKFSIIYIAIPLTISFIILLIPQVKRKFR